MISTEYVKIGEQLSNILTKSLNGDRVRYLCNKPIKARKELSLKELVTKAKRIREAN